MLDSGVREFLREKFLELGEVTQKGQSFIEDKLRELQKDSQGMFWENVKCQGEMNILEGCWHAVIMFEGKFRSTSGKTWAALL